MSPVHWLAPGDESGLAPFFDRHPDTTLFLQGNLAQAGLGQDGHPYQGVWGVFRDGGEIVSVAAHFNGGNLVVEGGVGLDELAQSVAERSGRPVKGLIGRVELVERLALSLGLAAKFSTKSREILFALNLDDLVLPPELSTGSVRCRVPRKDELEGLAAWRVEFGEESLGLSADAAARNAAHLSVTSQSESGRLFVLEDGQGRVVSSTAFNAHAGRVVQVGGVFTPPSLRGRRYGRCAVAGSLLVARTWGVDRSVLFTGRENRAAQAAYRSIGYREIGNYAIYLS